MGKRRRLERMTREDAKLNNTKAESRSRAKMKTMIEKSMQIWEIIPLPCPEPSINTELTISPLVSRELPPLPLKGSRALTLCLCEQLRTKIS
jgi:hypothetical protein